jgi:acetyl esterase/lipase
VNRKRIILFALILFLVSFFELRPQEPNSDTSVTYKIEQNILYRDKTSPGWDEYMEERCRLDIYYPSGMTNFATVIWFHGGGLRAGERFIPEQFKNQKIAVVAANYRLYPKVKNPAYIEDAAAAVAWVFENIRKYGGNPELIFVSGHSAGGYLTSMIGLDKRWLAAYEIDANRIAALIPFSGHTITHFTIREERGIPGEQAVVDKFAPLFHVRPDAPPLVLITGDRNLELLGRYEENAHLMRMMKVAGHQNTILYELQGFDHGEMVEPAYLLLLKYVKNYMKVSP